MTSPESRLTRVEAGTLLAQRRAEREITLEQAAQALHLPRRILEHLEAGHLDAFDARIYYLGHLRRYADWLGFSRDALIDRLVPLPEWESPVVAAKFREAEETPWGSTRTRWLPAVLSGIFLLAAAGILVSYFSGLPAGRLSSVLRSARPVPPVPPSAKASSTTRKSSRPVGARPAPPGAGELVLDFSLRHRSWIEIEHAGRIVYSALLPGGKTLTLRVAPPVRIHIGNAPAVRLTVDGTPFRLLPWTGSDRVAVLRLAAPPGKSLP